MSVFTYYFVEALRMAPDRVGREVKYRDVLRHVEDTVPYHRHKEQKKKNPNARVRQQTPLGFGARNFLLGQSRMHASISPRKQGESYEDREARLRGLRKTLYKSDE